MEQRTLKLKGTIKKKNVSILIDYGSTHNFVDIDIANKLNPFVYPTKDLTITIAYGQQVKSVGRCHKVHV
jgi:hypothetical protein